MVAGMKCPLDLCDGSGFVPLEDGDEDNCLHTDYPGVDWTPEEVAACLACYNLAHRPGIDPYPWCGRDGFEEPLP